MDKMVAGHVYNAVILNLAPSGALYGSAPDSPPFFSEGWWNILRRVLAKAKRQGMRIWLYDQLGFSTARIQDRLMERQPAWRAAELAVVQKDITGPTLVRMSAPGKALAACAVPLGADGNPTGKPLHLSTSLADGRLVKQMPSGRFRIMLFYEGRGAYDYMNPIAAGKLLNFVHGEFERKLKPYLDSTIPGTFQDELPPMNRWTRGFLDEFRKRKGYDLRPSLPMLWYDLGPRTSKVRCDVADVQATLLETAFFRPLYEWHRRHGMICSYDQMTRNADPIEANRYYVDYMRTMRWYQAPGTDQTGTAKPHSSLAHHYGRPRVWLEGFYNSGWGQTLEELASRIHTFYAQGANLYNPHAWYYTTLAGWWEWAPPCTSFRQPYWAHYSLFSDYVTRLSYVLSQGHHVCDVAVVYPSSSVHAATTYTGGSSAGASPSRTAATRARDAYWAICKELDDSGVDYDIVDEASLLRARTQAGFLAIGSERYRCVVLPSVSVLHRESVAKLATMASQGGLLAALGEPPSASPEHGDDDPAVIKAMLAAFGAEAEPIRRVGRGAAIHSQDDASALVKLIAERVPAHATGVKHCVHRRIGNADVYLLVGSPTRGAPKEVTLKGSGTASMADPWTGTLQPLPSRSSGTGRVAVRVPFDSAHATFVILSSGSAVAGRRQPAKGPIPASARIQAPKDGSSKAPAPITLDDEWRTALVPTLDNRWGDFARPAGQGPIPLERRVLLYREEPAGEDGVEAGWTQPEHPDENWESVTTGYGLRWWISRPDVGDRPLRMPGPDDGDWRPDPSVWKPAVFSLRTGIEKDPVYRQWLGPKGRVPDEYLDFGTAPEGTVRFAVTFVHVPQGCDVTIRTGVGDARVAVNGTWLAAGPIIGARLLAGYNAIAAQFRHTGSGALRTYVHIGPASAASTGPTWIWTEPNGDVSDCYARKTLVLKEAPNWATLSISADNGYEVYVNGTRVGRDVGAGNAHWAVAERYSIARHLRKGNNVIAVRGMNLGGPAGVLAELRYGGERRAARGERRDQVEGPPLVVTDASWKVTTRALPGWTRAGFDDSDWKPARIVGLHPCEPWGVIQNLQRSTPGILPESAWLNGAVLPWAPDLVVDPLPGMQKRVGWYRFPTPPGTSRIHVPAKGRFRLFLDGRECPQDGDGWVDVPLDQQEHSQICAIRVEQPAGRYGGGAFDEPIRFTVGIGAMKTGDWSRLGLAHYSGGVRYVQEVAIPPTHIGAPLMLDLGHVRGTAQVNVNGVSAGVRIWRPYRFDITDMLKAGINRIEVTVYNTLGPYFGAGYPTPYVLPGQEVSGIFGPVRVTGPPSPPPPPPTLTGLTNVALAANGATARASSEHPSGLYLADSVVAGHTTGERWAKGGGWNDATETEFPDWLEVVLAEPAGIQAVGVLTLEPADRHGIRDFDVEVRRGGAWVTCAEVRDNEDTSVLVPVPNIRSDRVRIVVHAVNDEAYSRIVGVRVYAPSPHP